jgi:hypothetical protein
MEVETGAGAVTLQLAQAFVIAGTVRFSDGSPAANVRVSASKKSEKGSNQVASEETNAAGDFVLRDIPAGSYDLTVGQNWWRSQGSGVVERTVEGVQAGQEGVQIEVSAGLSIQGEVILASGDPALEGWVSASRIPDPNEANPKSVSGNGTVQEGKFRVNGLIPGKYRISVNVPNVSARTVDAAAGSTDVVIRFSVGAKISGRVTGPSGEALVGASVSLQGVGENAGGGPNDQSDAEGRFEMSGVAPGTYYANLWYQKDEARFAGRSEEFTVGDGDDMNGVDIVGAKLQ